MSLKVVDVPEGAEEFLFEAYKNEMLVGKTQEGYVSSLPDAPTVAENATLEKRVIELPSEVLKEVIRLKKDNTLLSFLKLVDNYAYGKLYEFANESEFGDWYLGHTEFVPKKEPKYRYKLIGFDAVLTKNVVSGELFLMPGTNIEHQSFTHREIEKLASEKGFKLSAFKEIEVEE